MKRELVIDVKAVDVFNETENELYESMSIEEIEVVVKDIEQKISRMFLSHMNKNSTVSVHAHIENIDVT